MPLVAAARQGVPVADGLVFCFEAAIEGRLQNQVEFVIRLFNSVVSSASRSTSDYVFLFVFWNRLFRFSYFFQSEI